MKKLFDEQVARKPDLYPWTEDFMRAMWEGHWTDKEFNFQSDIQDFKVKISKQEKVLLTKALATIGQLEISVKKFWSKIGDNLPHPSINDMGYVFSSNEVIHGLAYERLLKVLGLENSFEEILELDIIKGRVNYLKKHLHKFHDDNRKQFVYSIILFSIFIENLALFSQFYTISYFGKFKNLLKDTNKQVEYTSREENLHFLAGAKIINVLREEYPSLFDQELEDKVLEESKKAIEYEFKIIEWIIDGYSSENLNSCLLKEFIKDRLNFSLEKIGYKKIFDIDQSLIEKTNWFNEQTVGNNMTDFFHNKPTEYSKSSQSFSQESLF